MMLRGLLSFLLCMVTVRGASKTGYDTSHLDAALHYYETLHADQLIHTLQPVLGRRCVSFRALGRDFKLHLKPNRQILASDFTVHEVDGNGHKHSHKVDHDAFLHGHLEGEDSRVTAHLSEEGVLSAVIVTPTETYHMEPSAHYIKEPHNFHMLLYARSHVKPRLNATRMDFVVPASHPNPHTIHKEGTLFSDENTVGTARDRLRRQAELGGNIAGDFCHMILIADYSTFLLFGSVSSASSQMVLLVSSVSMMIYSQTEWLVDVNDNVVRGLGLTVQQVLVHTSPSTGRRNYTTDRTDVDAPDILQFMRLEQWEDYCLAHLFTNRNFQSGLLGLANIASSLPSQTGGICSTRFRDSSQEQVIYNTGLSSYNNNGNTMILSEMIRVTGHELGHNWGSHHDPPQCSSFLMNEFAQDGSRDTHTMFSTCSRRSIGAVLLSKRGCFVAAPAGRCQDYRIDNGEDCDAGPSGDACCTPDCMLKPDAMCSDSNYLCCRDCQVANSSTICRSAPRVTPDCTGDTFCDGSRLDCPETPSPARVDQECIRGFCRALNTSAPSSGTGAVLTKCVEVCDTFCNCEGTDECLVCCLDGVVCSPATEMLFKTTGSPCSSGTCVNGACMDRTQDVVARVWRIITTLDGNALRELIEENIVGFILIFSVPLWAIGGYFIHFLVDRPRLRKYLEWEIDLKKRLHIQSIYRKALGKKMKMDAQVDASQPLLDEVEEEEEEEVQGQPVDPVDDSFPLTSVV